MMTKKGNLSVDMTIHKLTTEETGNIVFENIYTAPVIPNDPSPPTGDESILLMYAGLMYISIIGIVVFGKERKRMTK